MPYYSRDTILLKSTENVLQLPIFWFEFVWEKMVKYGGHVGCIHPAGPGIALIRTRQFMGQILPSGAMEKNKDYALLE